MATNIELIAQKCATIAANQSKIYDKGYNDCNAVVDEICLKEICLRDRSGILSGDIEIPETSELDCIGYYAFAGCWGITSIRIPATITIIRPYAFYDCRRLTEIIFEGTEAEWNNAVRSNTLFSEKYTPTITFLG